MGVRKSGYYNVALLTAGHFFSDFYANFLPALLPLVIAKLGFSLTLSGLLVMVYSVVSSVLQPVSGYYIDKYGYTWLLLVTTPVSAVFICMAGLADSKFMLFALVSLAGLGASVFHPLASSLMGKIVSNTNKGAAMSFFICGGNIGFAVAPAVIIYFLNKWDAATLLWLIIPGLAVTWASYARGLHRISIVSPVGQDGRDGSVAVWYKSRGLLLLNIVMALRSWVQVAIPTFLPILLVTAGYSVAEAGGMLTVFLLGGASGAIIGGWLGDRVGRKVGIIASLVICLPTAYWLLVNVNLSPLTYLLLAISGAALQSVVPSSIVWAQELIPGNAAMASGMMLGMSFGLGGVGTALTGALADHIGLGPALLWTLVAVILAIPLTAVIPQDHKNNGKQLLTDLKI